MWCRLRVLSNFDRLQRIGGSVSLNNTRSENTLFAYKFENRFYSIVSFCIVDGALVNCVFSVVAVNVLLTLRYDNHGRISVMYCLFQKSNNVVFITCPLLAEFVRALNNTRLTRKFVKCVGIEVD